MEHYHQSKYPLTTSTLLLSTPTGPNNILLISLMEWYNNGGSSPPPHMFCCTFISLYPPQQQSSVGHTPHIGHRVCCYCVCDEGTICNKTINRKWITAAETLEGSRSIRACCHRRHRIGFSWSSF